MSIINFLNKNDGAITTITTLILVGITLWYVIETMKMRRTTQEMLRVSNTPEVQVSLQYQSHLLSVSTIDLCIQNIGTGFAHDVQFTGSLLSFRPQLDKQPLGEYGIIKNGISHLGPGKRYQIILLWLTEDKYLPKEPLNVDITYMDPANNEQNKSCILDFKKIEGHTQLGDPSLDSIAFSLRFIQKDLSKIKNKYAPDSDTEGMN